MVNSTPQSAVLALAQEAINATVHLADALAASNAAADAHADADAARTQKLSDLANELDANGITAAEFVYGGYRFTRTGSVLKIAPLPPELGDLGGAQ